MDIEELERRCAQVAADQAAGKPWRVAIVGSRDFRWPCWVRQYVERLPDYAIVVTGGARGVDTWAEEAARARGLAVEVHPADWATHGKAAGPIRNRLIVAAADTVVAFWDGTSRGTKNTIDQARAAGKSVGLFRPSGPMDEPIETRSTRFSNQPLPDCW